MDRAFSRRLLVPVLAVLCFVLMVGCKSAPKAEPPVTQAPSFEAAPPAEPAEPVDETAGFKEPEPMVEVVEETTSDAETLNAQGLLQRIHFAFDKYDLQPEAIRTLGENAAAIKEHNLFNVRIEGHCDERGTVEYNLALGEKRARAARDYLVSLGVPARSLRVVSYGKERPLDPGHNERAWGRNRRADFLFLER